MATPGLFSLTVILPNARRSTVKVAPNTTILQILEDVCIKHQLNPAEFDLSHHNKTVELAKSLRFSAIPNNATLEMVQTTKPRLESTINLGLQLESGKRLMNPFLPHQTLWEVLDFWNKKGEQVLPEKDNAEQVEPVCIYMRQEVVGQPQLEGKTLRSLGLTQGSAMIRLIHRSAAQLKHQANVSAPLSRVLVAASATQTVQPETPTNINAEVVKDKETKDVKPHPHPPAPAAQTSEPMDVSPPISSRNSPSPIPVAHNSTHPATQNGHARENATVQPVDLSSNSTNVQQVFQPPVITNSHRFSEEGALNILGARDALLYHGDDVIVQPGSDSTLDDSFFELSVNDVRRMYSELKEKRMQLEEAPFQSKSATELAKNRQILTNLHDHPRTVVRIRFPNRYILQGTFRTADTIESISSWLQQFLLNPQMTFYLFTAPPKKVLEKSTRLVEEGLVRLAVIYFGTDDISAPVDQKVLKSEFYNKNKLSAPDAAYEFLLKKLSKSESTNDLENDSMDGTNFSTYGQQGHSEASGSQQAEGSSTQSSQAVRQPQINRHPVGSGKGGPVPKWFKAGK